MDDQATADEVVLPYGPLMSRALPGLHRAFLVLNRRLALPVLHAGLGPFWSLPFTGYMCILRTKGRKSGAKREAPLGYVIFEGAVYVWAGFGPQTQWLRNLEADPHVEVVLTGRAISGVAEVVTDPDERTRAGRALTAALGIIGVATLGGDPRTASADELERRTAGLPLVRIRPTGIAAGPLDPGGKAWIVYQLVAVWATWRAIGWVRRLVRRPRAGCCCTGGRRS